VRYFLDINYKGTHYHGWQVQPNGNTIQAELENALSIILKTEISIVGSGRTDTGVHASQQIAHFEYPDPIDPAKMVYKLNSFLPKDIGIAGLQKVSDEAHARFDATKRTYHYHIHRTKNPFKTETSYYFSQEVSTDLILDGCKIIGEWQNFESFSKVHTEVNNFNCEIFDIDWIEKKNNSLFIIQANRFLRGMVRAIVGTLLDVGMKKTSLDELKELLKKNDRSLAGRAVPAHGLFLEKIEYPDNIYL
jgi:tRNA pseudouridine38-40 synthase